MRAGLLKDTITLYERKFDEYDIDSDFAQDGLIPICSTRAQVKVEGSNIVNENGDIFYTSNVVFTIRWHNKVNCNTQIKYNGSMYRILGEPYKDYNLQAYVIKAEKIND